MEQISLAIRNINQATAQSMATVGRSGEAGHDLDDQALRLTATVEQYQPEA